MLPLEAEEFLSWMASERGRATNTLAAYRRDLDGYTAWLAAHGTTIREVDRACLDREDDVVSRSRIDKCAGYVRRRQSSCVAAISK